MRISLLRSTRVAGLCLSILLALTIASYSLPGDQGGAKPSANAAAPKFFNMPEGVAVRVVEPDPRETRMLAFLDSHVWEIDLRPQKEATGHGEPATTSKQRHKIDLRPEKEATGHGTGEFFVRTGGMETSLDGAFSIPAQGSRAFLVVRPADNSEEWSSASKIIIKLGVGGVTSRTVRDNPFKGFKITYSSDGDETVVTKDGAVILMGFCKDHPGYFPPTKEEWDSPDTLFLLMRVRPRK